MPTYTRINILINALSNFTEHNKITEIQNFWSNLEYNTRNKFFNPRERLMMPEVYQQTNTIIVSSNSCLENNCVNPRIDYRLLYFL